MNLLAPSRITPGFNQRSLSQHGASCSRFSLPRDLRNGAVALCSELGMVDIVSSGSVEDLDSGPHLDPVPQVFVCYQQLPPETNKTTLC